jgi:hypothetical protein
VIKALLKEKAVSSNICSYSQRERRHQMPQRA